MSRLPQTRCAVSGFKASIVDRLFEQTYRDLNDVERKLLALVQSKLGTSAQVSGDIGPFEVRNGVKAIASGESTITFDAPFSSSGATIVFQAMNAADETLTIALTGQSKSNFTIVSPDAGVLHYFAINTRSSKKVTGRATLPFVR
jgi:hypothetical protein